MKKKKTNKIKKTLMSYALGTTIGLSVLGLINSTEDKEKIGKPISIVDIVDDDYKLETPKELQREIYKLKYARQCIISMYKYNEKKKRVLNNYKKCETLDDILSRQKELESLNLTDDDKIYKDCNASAEIQHFIYEQSITNNVPFDYLMAIGDVETRSMFNANGVASYNPSSNTYDLGYTQQNSGASLPVFAEKYNVSYEEAWDLLLNNDYANVCAAFLVIDEIDKCHAEFDPYEYAGCYNGWLGWKNYSSSQKYVYNYFTKAYNESYTEHHNIENVKINTDKAKTKTK